jgi:sugar phosphate isomerase/epimerase
MLSITTDYFNDSGNPAPYLRRIAEAGFSHIHWCHHWRSDFLYSDAEIDQISKWLQEFGLQLNDLHGSEGMEKSWVSAQEYRRLAGVELVKNRIYMAAKLGGDVVIMHETTIHNTGIEDEPVFLEKAFEAGTTLAGMIEDYS